MTRKIPEIGQNKRLQIIFLNKSSKNEINTNENSLKSIFMANYALKITLLPIFTMTTIFLNNMSKMNKKYHLADIL
jgi:hypothetical protein